MLGNRFVLSVFAVAFALVASEPGYARIFRRAACRGRCGGGPLQRRGRINPNNGQILNGQLGNQIVTDQFGNQILTDAFGNPILNQGLGNQIVVGDQVFNTDQFGNIIGPANGGIGGGQFLSNGIGGGQFINAGIGSSPFINAGIGGGQFINTGIGGGQFLNRGFGGGQFVNSGFGRGQIVNGGIINGQIINPGFGGGQIINTGIGGTPFIGNGVNGSGPGILLTDGAGNPVRIASDRFGQLVDGAGNQFVVPRDQENNPLDRFGNILKVVKDNNGNPFLIAIGRNGGPAIGANFGNIRIPIDGSGNVIRPILASNTVINNGNFGSFGNNGGSGGNNNNQDPFLRNNNGTQGSEPVVTTNRFQNLRKLRDPRTGRVTLLGRDTDGQFKPLFINRKTGELTGTRDSSTLRDLRDYYSENRNSFTDPADQELVKNFLASKQVAGIFLDPAPDQKNKPGSGGHDGVAGHEPGRPVNPSPEEKPTRFIELKKEFASGEKPDKFAVRDFIKSENDRNLSKADTVAKKLWCWEKDDQKTKVPLTMFYYRKEIPLGGHLTASRPTLEMSFSFNDIAIDQLKDEAQKMKDLSHPMEEPPSLQSTDAPKPDKLIADFDNKSKDVHWEFNFKKAVPPKDPLDMVLWVKKVDKKDSTKNKVWYCK